MVRLAKPRPSASELWRVRVYFAGLPEELEAR